MENRLLIAAIIVITSALVFYTIGVWGEKLQRGLRLWHVILFCMGISADIGGTTLMEHIARQTGVRDNLHAITGCIAVILMLIHAIWAIYTYYRGSYRAKLNFSKFSILVWAIWLIPYGIGVYIGMTTSP